MGNSFVGFLKLCCINCPPLYYYECITISLRRLSLGQSHMQYIITGMTQEGLFRVNGSMKMVEQLRLQYERGEEVELVKDGDVYSAASLLKLFLRELPDGIITSALHPRFIQLYQGKQEVKSPCTFFLDNCLCSEQKLLVS